MGHMKEKLRSYKRSQKNINDFTINDCVREIASYYIRHWLWLQTWIGCHLLNFDVWCKLQGYNIRLSSNHYIYLNTIHVELNDD